jgi:hypothetical protein
MNGGAEGIRTPDLLIANQPLYQLSYDPIHVVRLGYFWHKTTFGAIKILLINTLLQRCFSGVPGEQ